MRTMHPALLTCEVPIFFATSEGQTRKIAEALAEMLHQRGLDSCAIDIASGDADWVDWTRVRAAVVGASIHAGRHQRAAARFVRVHAAALNRHPSAFFSVSLSAASSKPAGRDAARAIADAFPGPLGWTPQAIACVAGALVYSQYGFVKRFVMRRIARPEGGPTDTSRDYEMTDWTAVAELADRIAALAAREVANAA